MKPIILLILLAAAVAFYFGYEPYDLVVMFKPTTTEPVKHARVKTAEATEQAPERGNTTIVDAPAPDGSLQQRWPKTVSTPTPSPAKQ
jgi:hypothetical protein